MNGALTRRTFLQSAMAVAAAEAVTPGLRAFALQPARSAWIAAEGGIHCLRNSGADWLRTDFVECDAPTALALHPPTQTLYVSHGTQSFLRLPTGSISCYRFGSGKGLTLLKRQELSLACVRPDAVAVSPQGEMLIVASGHAGILNALPIDRQGVPSPVTAVRKELSWNLPGEQEAGQLSLKFLDDLSLVASRSGRSLRYECTLDGFHSLGQNTAHLYGMTELPRPLATVMLQFTGGTQQPPAVWL